jgi:hypothetical protein
MRLASLSRRAFGGRPPASHVAARWKRSDLQNFRHLSHFRGVGWARPTGTN